MMLSDVCLSVCLASVAYIGSKSRTERPRKIQIGIEVVTRDSDTPLSSSKGHRSRSPGRFTRRGLIASCRCSGDRENVLGKGNYCYVASARRRVRHFGAHGGGEGRGISCRHAHSLLLAKFACISDLVSLLPLCSMLTN